MALHEEHSENMQRKWLSRLARERRDLSVSVEATLRDSENDNGLQDIQEQGEVGRQGGSTQSSQGTTLIPPRLSLQSKLMTAIQPGSFVESASRAHPAVPPEAEGEQKCASSTSRMHNTNMLARFAQRITTSLAALGSTMQPEAVLLADSVQEKPREEASQLEKKVIATPESQEQQPAEEEVDPLLPVKASTEPVRPPQSKQRLAGRTGKIRLETAVLPISELMPEARKKEIGAQQKVRTENTGNAGKTGKTDSSEYRAATTPKSDATSAHLPTVRKSLDTREKGMTSAHLTAMGSFKGMVGTSARGTLSGSGVIESKQRDIIVANKHITPASIVLVMLTNDPGPVVVQYVSLQPGVGFTVHLTAPAAMRTAFNYVILPGELF